MFLLLTLVLSVPQQATDQGPNVTRLTMAAPSPVVDVDTSQMKGELAMLAWSPDGLELFLKAVERDRKGNEKATYYLLTVDEPAKGLVQADSQPPWVDKYWAWKSSPFAPKNPSFKIELESRKETVRATHTANAGNLAGMTPSAGSGGEGMPQDVIAGAAVQSQQNVVTTMRLKGEVLGEWTNENVKPGLTFGWAPSSLGVIAFVEKKNGQVVIMDPEGRKRGIEGSKDSLLPAWSLDGTRLAYLQRKDKKKYSLTLVEVTPPPETH